MFGKVMSLPDDIIALYFELLTDIPEDELDAIRAAMSGEGGLNPMDIKKRLGEELTATFHSKEDATAAREEFERIFQRREMPEDIPSIAVDLASPAVASHDADGFDADLSHLLPALNMAASRSEARRLLQQNAVQIDGERPENERVRIPFGALIRVGSRRFVRVVRG